MTLIIDCKLSAALTRVSRKWRKLIDRKLKLWYNYISKDNMDDITAGNTTKDTESLALTALKEGIGKHCNKKL